MTKHRRTPCLIGCLILLCILSVPCYGVIWLLEGERVFSTSINEWRANRWVKSTYEDVLAITDDEKLLEIQGPEVTEGGTMRCVSAGASQAFGTQRAYEHVVEEYASWLRKHGWKELSRKSSTEHSFYDPDDSFARMLTIFPYQLEESVDFQTVYAVDVSWFEARCTPYGWNPE